MTIRDLDFMIWLHHRLTEVHGENPDYDYMHKLRAVINALPPMQTTPNMGNITITDLEVKNVKERKAALSK